jgi:hypothetical protein
MVIDIPRYGADVGQQFTVAGWAFDGRGGRGTGIDTLHVWAHPVDGGAPIWLGVAASDGSRPDVAAVYGERFARSGFSIDVSGLAPGTYDIVVYAHSETTGRFDLAQPVRVTVK